MVQNTCKIYYTNSGSSKRKIEINIGTYVEFSIKEDTRRQRGVEPDPRTFKRDLQQIIPQGFKGLSLLSNGTNKTNLIHLFVNFLKKYEKDVPIIVNDGEHKCSIQNGASLVLLFSCNHEDVDSRTALHASKSSRNVAIVAEDTNFLMLLIYSYSTCGISKEWVLKYDTSSYADIGAICKYLGNTSNRNILQYLAITDCDTTTVFYRIGKISPFKEVL